ncbi:MAG TPA: fibronectin type III domain-containing protein [Candidatus Acidoferrales bacterium]|nr:fibronectin type III domain-containing protein [Candidatus Acidoferrales bacterium]
MEQLRLGIVRGIFSSSFSIAQILESFSLSLILALFVVGCAAPGEPIVRRPAVAQGVNDLAAKQTGNSVMLTLTLPKETIEGNPLRQAPEIKVYREFLPAAPASPASAARPAAPNQLILTVTPQMQAQYREGNRLRIPASLAASDVSAFAGEIAVYMVRTRISTRDSADSNLAEALILPSALPIEDLHAQVTKTGIELSWTPAATPSKSTLGPMTIRYRVYRTQGASATAQGGLTLGAQPNPAAPAFTLLGETASPSFNDANFTFDLTYEYTVRSVARYGAGEVESENSTPLIVTPRDTFPPDAPMELVAAVVPAGGGEPLRVDLSWDISPEADVAGYNVYQSEEEQAAGKRMNSQPLPTPVFRDISVLAGHRYFYRVTAVDRSGNESTPSAAVAVTLPGASEQEKK